MNAVSEIHKINPWLSFYFTQYNTSPPESVEGRVHPIQFSHSIIRINATGRSLREKKLFLQIMFAMGCFILIVYPIFDTDYYFPILLVFGGVVLLDYIYYSRVEDKATSLMLDSINRENESFAESGMRFHWNPLNHKLFVEVDLKAQPDHTKFVPAEHIPSFKTLHRTYTNQLLSEDTPLISQQNEDIEVDGEDMERKKESTVIDA